MAKVNVGVVVEELEDTASLAWACWVDSEDSRLFSKNEDRICRVKWADLVYVGDIVSLMVGNGLLCFVVVLYLIPKR